MPPNKGISYRAVIPRRSPFPEPARVISKVGATLLLFGHDGQGKLSNYPPSRSSYRRTGNLGRKWTVSGPKVGANSIKVTIGNNADYAIWVQGPTEGPGRKQVSWAERYGWLSVTAVRKKVWPRYRLLIIKILSGK